MESDVIQTMTIRLAAGAALVVLALGTAGCKHGHGLHGSEAHAAQPEATATVNMQGNDAAAWAADPNMHRFYEAARTAFADGAANVDVSAFEATSRAIFHDFAVSRKADPAAMQDHLKAIPRQVVDIATEDPKVLDSYEAFTVALMGPP